MLNRDALVLLILGKMCSDGEGENVAGSDALGDFALTKTRPVTRFGWEKICLLRAEGPAVSPRILDSQLPVVLDKGNEKLRNSPFLQC